MNEYLFVVLAFVAVSHISVTSSAPFQSHPQEYDTFQYEDENEDSSIQFGDDRKNIIKAKHPYSEDRSDIEHKPEGDFNSYRHEYAEFYSEEMGEKNLVHDPEVIRRQLEEQKRKNAILKKRPMKSTKYGYKSQNFDNDDEIAFLPSHHDTNQPRSILKALNKTRSKDDEQLLTDKSVEVSNQIVKEKSVSDLQNSTKRSPETFDLLKREGGEHDVPKIVVPESTFENEERDRKFQKNILNSILKAKRYKPLLKNTDEEENPKRLRDLVEKVSELKNVNGGSKELKKLNQLYYDFDAVEVRNKAKAKENEKVVNKNDIIDYDLDEEYYKSNNDESKAIEEEIKRYEIEYKKRNRNRFNNMKPKKKGVLCDKKEKSYKDLYDDYDDDDYEKNMNKRTEKIKDNGKAEPAIHEYQNYYYNSSNDDYDNVPDLMKRDVKPSREDDNDDEILMTRYKTDSQPTDIRSPRSTEIH